MNTAQETLGLRDQVLKGFVGSDIQSREAIEELGEIGNRRIPEDLRLAVGFATEPLGQMIHQAAQFFRKRRFSQLDCFIEPLSNTTRFGFVRRRGKRAADNPAA